MRGEKYPAHSKRRGRLPGAWRQANIVAIPHRASSCRQRGRCRDESRHGTHECVRHIESGLLFAMVRSHWAVTLMPRSKPASP